MRGSGADVPPPDRADGDAEAERLRRALYRAGATAADRARYAALVAPDRPDESRPAEHRDAVPTPVRASPTRGRAAALVVVTVVLALGVLALVRSTAWSAPRPSATAAAAPILLQTVGLPGEDAAADGLADQVFRHPGSAAASSAVDLLVDRARSTVDPTWATRAVRASGGGTQDSGAVLAMTASGIEARRGDRVTVSVVTKAPAAVEWTFLGYRAGERRVPHPVLVVRSPRFRLQRIALATTRLPADLHVTGMRLAVTPRTPLAYAYLDQPRLRP